MVTIEDFDKYHLESLLDCSKWQIDTEDPERADLANTAVGALQALHKYQTISSLERLYTAHGMTDSFKSDYFSAMGGLGYTKADLEATPISTLKSKALSIVSSKLEKFNTCVSNSAYTIRLLEDLDALRKDVEEIAADESTTYKYCDHSAFASTKIYGCNYVACYNRLKGIQMLLGAISSAPDSLYKTKSLVNEWHDYLLRAGMVFTGEFVTPPRDATVGQLGTLEALGWTPERVHEISDMLQSVLTLELHTRNILPVSVGSFTDAKQTSLFVENCYNARKIMGYTKAVIKVIAEQYLTMVRSYQ